MTQILTANRLTDGRIVYHAADGGWAESLDRARVFAAEEADEAEAAGRRDEDARLIVGAYLFPVEAGEGAIRPLSMRERIRASGGPTIVPPVDQLAFAAE